MSSRPTLLALLVTLAAPSLARAQALDPLPIRTGNPEAAQAFRQGLEAVFNLERSQAQKPLRRAVQLDPQFALAYAFLGKVTGGAEGLADCEKAAALSATADAAQKLTVEVFLAELRGEDEQARKLKRELADAAPTQWFAQFQEGQQAWYDRRSQAAILYLQRAIKLDPSRPQAFNYLGYVLAWQGQLDAGIEALNQAVALTPKEPNAHDSLGELLLRAGRFNDAERSFRRAVELGPDEWMSWVGVAYARFFRGEWDSGRAALAQALRIKNLSPQERFSCELVVAYSHLAQGQLAPALKLLDAAAKEATRRKDALDEARAPIERATLLFHAGKVDEARGPAEEGLANSLRPGLTGAQMNLLRRRALTLELASAQARVDRPLLKSLVDQVEAEFARAPSNEQLRGLSHFARGLAAEQAGELGHARAELSLCLETDYVCRQALSRVEAAQGDTKAAQEVAEKLANRDARDPLHRGEPPLYLLIRAEAQPGATPGHLASATPKP